MRLVVFCHSLLSDWNHGNAHFLRGVVAELVARGCAVEVYEPEDAWSMQHLLAEPRGPATLQAVAAARASSRSMLAELQAADTLRRTEAEQAQLAFQQARAQAIGLEKLEAQHDLSAAAEELHGEQVVLDEIASGAWHRGEGSR